MANKEQIKDIYKKKIKEIKKHNDLYFNKDRPSINDSEYDALKRDIFDLEKKNKYLKDLNLTAGLVGSPPSNKFKKIKHLKPMLSLSNAFDKNDMKDFLNKVNNFLNLKGKELELFSEPKIDGISATLIYEKGKLIRGLSRGDGITGEDILENLKTIRKIPKQIEGSNVPDILEIRCEIYIEKKISKTLKEILQIREMLQVVL